MAVDWYRKTTWTKEDENGFFQKLKKPQKYNRPQYVIIQNTGGRSGQYRKHRF
jgi:hypothetical protein